MAISYKDLYPNDDIITSSEWMRLVRHAPEIEPELREFAMMYQRTGARAADVLLACEALIRSLGSYLSQGRLYPAVQTEIADQKIEILELQEEIAVLEEEKEALIEVLDAYQRGDVGSLEDLREKYLTVDASIE